MPEIRNHFQQGKMNKDDYRTETTAKLVKLDERQISIFKSTKF